MVTTDSVAVGAVVALDFNTSSVSSSGDFIRFFGGGKGRLFGGSFRWGLVGEKCVWWDLMGP